MIVEGIVAGEARFLLQCVKIFREKLGKFLSEDSFTSMIKKQFETFTQFFYN